MQTTGSHIELILVYHLIYILVEQTVCFTN